MVEEVVHVAKAFAYSQAQLTQPDLMGVITKPEPTGFGHSVFFGMDDEVMQIAVRPPEGHLEDVMELGETGIARHDQPPPDRRTDLGNRGLELEDLWRG